MSVDGRVRAEFDPVKHALELYLDMVYLRENVYIHTCTCTCAWYTCTHVSHEHAQARTHTHTYTHAHTHDTRTHTQRHTHTHTNTHTHHPPTHPPTHTHTTHPPTHPHTHTYTQVNLFMYLVRIQLESQRNDERGQSGHTSNARGRALGGRTPPLRPGLR